MVELRLMIRPRVHHADTTPHATSKETDVSRLPAQLWKSLPKWS